MGQKKLSNMQRLGLLISGMQSWDQTEENWGLFKASITGASPNHMNFDINLSSFPRDEEIHGYTGTTASYTEMKCINVCM